MSKKSGVMRQMLLMPVVTIMLVTTSFVENSNAQAPLDVLDIGSLRVTVAPVHLFAPPCTSETVTLSFRNLGVDPMTVNYTSGYTLEDLLCVQNYLPTSEAGIVINGGATVTRIITVNFAENCIGHTQIQFAGVDAADPGNAGTAKLDVWCDTKVPTVSEWGLIVMTLVVLTAGTVVISRRRRAAAA